MGACIYGLFGSKACSSPVPILIPATFPSAPASPTAWLAPLWGTAVLLLPLGIIQTPVCCPLGLKTGMVVMGIWSLLVLCLSSKKDFLIREIQGPLETFLALGAGLCLLGILCCGAIVALSAPQRHQDWDVGCAHACRGTPWHLGTCSRCLCGHTSSCGPEAQGSKQGPRPPVESLFQCSHLTYGSTRVVSRFQPPLQCLRGFGPGLAWDPSGICVS